MLITVVQTVLFLCFSPSPTHTPPPLLPTHPPPTNPFIWSAHFLPMLVSHSHFLSEKYQKMSILLLYSGGRDICIIPGVTIFNPLALPLVLHLIPIVEIPLGGEGGMDAKMGHQQWQWQIWCQRRGIGGTDDPTINKKIMMAARGGGAAAESKHFNGNYMGPHNEYEADDVEAPRPAPHRQMIQK